jgi:hypothetical protein
MGAINSVLYTPTDNWKQGKETPDTPSNFPKTPEDIKSHPDKYLGWLGRIAKEHPDPACRNFASIKYKIEYFARQTETNQMTDSANKEIDNANDGIVKAKGIQTACEAGEILCGAVYLGGALRVLGASLGPAIINTIQKSGEKALNIIRNTVGQFYLKLRSGLKIPLSKDQVKSLMRNNANSASKQTSNIKPTPNIEAMKNIKLDPKQLQEKYKHAKDFGIEGNYNKDNLKIFENAIKEHISKAQKIEGLYRNDIKVTHYFDPATKNNVIIDSNGNFISSWKLSPAQVMNLLKHGNIR